MLPRLALEYGESVSASSNKVSPISRSTPGMLTLRRPRSKTSVSRVEVYFGVYGDVSGKGDPSLRAAMPIALSKQADQPAARSCSGLVPPPGARGRLAECDVDHSNISRILPWSQRSDEERINKMEVTQGGI